jgi:hypothetical protein
MLCYVHALASQLATIAGPLRRGDQARSPSYAPSWIATLAGRRRGDALSIRGDAHDTIAVVARAGREPRPPIDEDSRLVTSSVTGTASW